MRLLHAVAFSKKLRWLTQTKVITLKTKPHAVNACVKRSSQRSFKLILNCFKKIAVVVFDLTSLFFGKVITNFTTKINLQWDDEFSKNFVSPWTP